MTSDKGTLRGVAENGSVENGTAKNGSVEHGLGFTSPAQRTRSFGTSLLNECSGENFLTQGCDRIVCG